MNTLKKLFPIIMVVVMLFGMMAATTASAAAAETVTGCKQWHVVQKGETLSQIANLYDTYYPKLAEINGLANPDFIYIGQSLCVSVDGTSTTPILPNNSAGIRVYATKAKEDASVTLQGKNLVTYSSYSIYLSNYKSKQPVSYKVGTVTTDKYGAFKETYNIPKNLYDVGVIKVMITNGKGDVASNWFYNMTTSENTGGIDSKTLSFTITSVKAGKTVTIKATNLLPNIRYKVFIGRQTTLGIGGILVGSLISEKGGTVTATFDIPAELAQRSNLALRVQNTNLNLAAYKIFGN